MFSGKSTPEEVDVAGRKLTCQICGHTEFWHRSALLNTAIATFFSLDWANRRAVCYVCDRCGFIYWFLPPE